ncbi:MAG: holo-ACP synthase [Geothermobacteraceae bacterium]
MASGSRRTVGLGVDLVRVERFRDFLRRDKQALLQRLFTGDELAYCLPRKDPAPHLAARFAAKEALLKALGLGLRDGLSWQDMEVARDPLGRPFFRLAGRAAELLAEKNLSEPLLSYSHDGDYATATVILETSCGC